MLILLIDVFLGKKLMYRFEKGQEKSMAGRDLKMVGCSNFGTNL